MLLKSQLGFLRKVKKMKFPVKSFVALAVVWIVVGTISAMADDTQLCFSASLYGAGLSCTGKIRVIRAESANVERDIGVYLFSVNQCISRPLSPGTQPSQRSILIGNCIRGIL